MNTNTTQFGGSKVTTKSYRLEISRLNSAKDEYLPTIATSARTHRSSTLIILSRAGRRRGELLAK